MGYYVNPTPPMTKEQFLERNGKPMTADEAKKFDFNVNKNHLPVCLVQNPGFTAAGIAYDAHERDAFARHDHRTKEWFLVSRKDLEPYYKAG